MANITFFSQAVDMTEVDISGLTGGGIVSSSDTELVFEDSNHFGELDVHGKNFSDFQDGIPHVGTVLGFDIFLFGDEVASFSKMHMDINTLNGFLAADDSAGLVNEILKGNDHILGSTEDDVLIGLKGRDQIDGNTGDDTLIGGAGGDTLTGGDGDDSFVYASTKDSGKKGVDTIADLDAGDHIDLSAIDADTHTDGDQAFHIVAKLKGHAGEMTVVYDAEHDRTIISLDATGDGKADGVIWLDGDHHAFSGWVL